MAADAEYASAPVATSEGQVDPSTPEGQAN